MTEVRNRTKFDTAENLHWAKANVSQLISDRDVTGMAGGAPGNSTAIGLDAEDVKPGFVMSDEGERPETPLASAGMIIGGLITGVLAAFYWISRLSPQNQSRE